MKPLLLFGCLSVFLISIFISCQKELSFESDKTLAHGSLYDSAGNCYPSTVSGTYYNGVAATRDTNYIKIVVNVTTTGTYTISTGTQNGFGFSDTGYFGKTGADTILLHAFGTPIVNNPTDFTFSFDTTTCGFTINVQDSTGTGLGGGTGEVPDPFDTSYVDPNPASVDTWHFDDSITTASYSGTFLTPGTIADIDNENSSFTVSGLSNNGNTVFNLAFLYKKTDGIHTGVYLIGEQAVIEVDSVADGSLVYVADQTSADEGTNTSYIRITKYDPVDNIVEGSFHAWVEDVNAELSLIKGSFSSHIQQ